MAALDANSLGNFLKAIQPIKSYQKNLMTAKMVAKSGLHAAMRNPVGVLGKGAAAGVGVNAVLNLMNGQNITDGMAGSAVKGAVGFAGLKGLSRMRGLSKIASRGAGNSNFARLRRAATGAENSWQNWSKNTSGRPDRKVWMDAWESKIKEAQASAALAA